MSQESLHRPEDMISACRPPLKSILALRFPASDIGIDTNGDEVPQAYS
jgi:hypothetical protein